METWQFSKLSSLMNWKQDDQPTDNLNSNIFVYIFQILSRNLRAHLKLSSNSNLQLDERAFIIIHEKASKMSWKRFLEKTKPLKNIDCVPSSKGSKAQMSLISLIPSFSILTLGSCISSIFFDLCVCTLMEVGNAKVIMSCMCWWLLIIYIFPFLLRVYCGWRFQSLKSCQAIHLKLHWTSKDSSGKTSQLLLWIIVWWFKRENVNQVIIQLWQESFQSAHIRSSLPNTTRTRCIMSLTNMECWRFISTPKDLTQKPQRPIKFIKNSFQWRQRNYFC